MILKFLGVGSAFTTPEYYQSNMLLTGSTGRRMLIDCGSDIRFSLAECGIYGGNLSERIDAIYISHLHADHVGGLEWAAFNTYFSPSPLRPELFMEEGAMQRMWSTCLKGGLGCIEGKIMHLADYFTCRPVVEKGSFLWDGIRFTLVRMPHVLARYRNHYSHGLLIEDTEKKGSLFISTDTRLQSDLLNEVAAGMTLIFHDCETTPYKSSIHAHYDDLCALPASIKQKMWLYHYQPDPVQKPEKDGFKGFIKKGQEFDFDL